MKAEVEVVDTISVGLFLVRLAKALARPLTDPGE